MRAIPIITLVCAFLLIKLSANPSVLDDPTFVGYDLTGDHGGEGIFELGTIIGEIIVFLFYWFKFNDWAGEGEAPSGFRPRPARHFTTWLRYIGWNSFYGLLMVGAYSLIVFFPEVIHRLINSYVTASSAAGVTLPGVNEAQGFFQSIMSSNELGVYEPVDPEQLAPYAVLLTTVVWAGMRPFSEFERRFRLRLQEQAAIPTEAKRLVETFEREPATFIPEEETIDKVVTKFNGLLDNNDFKSNANLVTFRYARVEYLNYLLLKYSRRPLFSRLTERYSGELNSLEILLNKVRLRISQRIEDIHELMCEEQESTPKPTLAVAENWLSENRAKLTNSQARYLKTLAEELEEEIDSVSHHLLQLIVCSTLVVGRSAVQRKDLLNAFNLKQPGKLAIPLDQNTIFFVSLVTSAAVFSCSVIYYFSLNEMEMSSHTIPIPKSLNEVIWWSIISGLMHLLALLGGYSIQRSFGDQREQMRIGKSRPLPFNAQFVEACFAAFLGFSLNIVLFGILMAIDGKFSDLAKYWWWAQVPAVTAFFTAIHTQRVDRSEKLRNWLVAMQTAATAVMALLVFIFIHSDDIYAFTSEGQQVPTAAVKYGIYVIIASATIGLALSLIMRDWVILERYGGSKDRRKAKRLKSKGKVTWQEDSKIDATAETLTMVLRKISDTGAELICSNPPKDKEIGQLTLPKKQPRRAQVVYSDEKRCYVKFLDKAA